MTRVAASVQGSLEAAAESRHAAAGALREPLVWPAGAIALLGGLCVLIGLSYFVVRLCRAFTRARTRRDG
jgi:hypothetical protein